MGGELVPADAAEFVSCATAGVLCLPMWPWLSVKSPKVIQTVDPWQRVAAAQASSATVCRSRWTRRIT